MNLFQNTIKYDILLKFFYLIHKSSLYLPNCDPEDRERRGIVSPSDETNNLKNKLKVQVRHCLLSTWPLQTTNIRLS